MERKDNGSPNAKVDIKDPRTRLPKHHNRGGRQKKVNEVGTDEDPHCDCLVYKISYTLLYMLGMLVKPFIAVLVLYSSSADGASASALLVLGEHLIYNGCGCAWASLWHGHVPGSAMLLVPDIPLTDKKQ